MDDSIKPLIEKACSLSIEAAEAAYRMGSQGSRADPEAEREMLSRKADYEATVAVLREADPRGFKQHIAQVAEVTRWAMQSRMANRRWRCKVCGYVYAEADGLVESGINPGTRMADLPTDWCCPECEVGKDQFELV